MTLSSGARLGPYEILTPLGSGGMGEVYRARDTRLERMVAVKVLPAHLSSSPDARQRFEREARTISQLSHPHICGLFDVGREGETDYLVMELLEGEILTDRLARGPLPQDQTLRYGSEIADALEKAHRHGIVHRDLKPGNVMLTKAGVKLLDFGLAKAMTAPVAPSGETSLPTMMGTANNLTQQGTILGTFQYMSPEQLEGKEADARADIFALGCVLYEMATGKKAFSGSSQASLISSIMKEEPQPVSTVQPMTPPALDRVIKTCLAKDPEERWQSAGDVAKELRWIAEGSAAGVASPAAVSTRRSRRERLAWTVAALAVAAAAAGWLGPLRRRTVAATDGVSRASLLLPERISLKTAVISPDGRRVAFSGEDASGRVQLWIRPLDSYSATPLAGTDGAIFPFWSPDGRFIGFFADKKLKRIESSGGSPLSLRDVDGVGGAWSPGGDILFEAASGPIYRIPATGGQPTAITRVDASRHETSHRYPFFLPDGRHFLYIALNASGNPRDSANRIWVGSVDGGAAKPLIPAGFNPQYSEGYLLFMRGGSNVGGSLLAQPFDPDRLETSGEPVTVAEQVRPYPDYLGYAIFSVSRTGTLLFDGSRFQSRLAWFDRSGKLTEYLGEPATHFSPAISPDGSRIAFDVDDPGSSTTQIWIADVSRGVRTRLTSGPGSNAGAVWSPDGSRIAFQSDRKHQAGLYTRAATGGGTEQALIDTDNQSIPQAWSKDGRFIAYMDREGAGNRSMQISGASTGGPPQTFVIAPRSPNDYGSARISPDDRWIAYDLDESGRREVYAVSFPGGEGRVQISSNGGFGAKWTRHGAEILYNGFDGKIMSVPMEAKGGLRAGTPRALFQLPDGASLPGNWDVSLDGERFLVNVPVVASSAIPLNVVFHWAAGLAREK